jgi:hypothetical protein
VTFSCGDVRDADLEHGAAIASPGASANFVFFLYAPFTGPVLDEVSKRLRAVAERRAITVCALGVEVGREHERCSLVATSTRSG